MALSIVVLICSCASLVGSIALLITTLRVHRAVDQIERRGVARDIEPLLNRASKALAGGVTECVPCHRYWVPSIFGPRVGEPCSECGRPVTAEGPK